MTEVEARYVTHPHDTRSPSSDSSSIHSHASQDEFQDALSSLAASNVAPDLEPTPGSPPRKPLTGSSAPIADPDAPPAFPSLDSAQRTTSARVAPSSIARPNHQPNPSFTVSGPALSAQKPPPAAPTVAPTSSSSSSTAGAASSTAARSATAQKASTLKDVLGIRTNTAATAMPPPPSRGAAPPSATLSTTSLAPPASAASLLRVPPSTTSATAPQGVGGAGGAALLRPNNAGGGAAAGLGVPTETGGGIRKKVALDPGCSALDWARLKNSSDLRGGITGLLRVTPSELKRHTQPHDAWSSFNGKVYNLTPYLRFHPGGKQELMRVAGRDGTRLFMLTHSWVNIDAIIDACMIGVLVSEHSN